MGLKLGLFKSTSPSHGLAVVPEPSLQAWACLLWAKPRTEMSSLMEYECPNTISESGPRGEKLCTCWVLNWRSQPCTASYSRGVLPGGLRAARQKVLWEPLGEEQGNMLRGEHARQRKERHSECRCIPKIHSHHLFLQAFINSFKFHWNLIPMWGIFTFVHWLGMWQKDKLLILFIHIDLF